MCRAGLRLRLMVPIGLGAGVWACNHSSLYTVTRTEEGCLILGFLSYKVMPWQSLHCSFAISHVHLYQCRRVHREQLSKVIVHA